MQTSFRPSSYDSLPLLELFVDRPLRGPTVCVFRAQSEPAALLFLVAVEPYLKIRTRTAACPELLEIPVGSRRVVCRPLPDSTLRRPSAFATLSCIAPVIRPTRTYNVLLMKSVGTDVFASHPHHVLISY